MIFRIEINLKFKMNAGLFGAQINEIAGILKEIELYEDRVFNPPYPPNPAPIFRKLTYMETWELCFRERYFDYQLFDDSLLQFRVESYNPLKISYVYYECPYIPTYPFPEFLRDYLEFEDWDSPKYNRRDFEDYYSLATKKEVVTPIRYDFDTNGYMEGRHPASHIHFGHKSNIRVGTKKILRPISFICLIVRQVYPSYWQKLVKITNAPNIARNIRETLDDIESTYWNPLDDWEMFLA